MSLFSTRTSNASSSPSEDNSPPDRISPQDNQSAPMTDQTNPTHDQVNLIGEGTTFEGTVRAESDVRASGQIVGTLDVEGRAFIAENGSVDGEIIATNAEIAGRVEGEIEVEERLVLKSTAQVHGTIDTDRLVVEEGAQFTGECSMKTPMAGNGEATGDAEEAGTVPRAEAEENSSSSRKKVAKI